MAAESLHDIAHNALNRGPCGVVAIDDRDQILWGNETFANMAGEQVDKLAGPVSERLPQTARALLSAATPLRIDGVEGERWIAREEHKVDLGARRLRYLYFRDVTDEMRLRAQVEQLTVTDDLTGLPNQRAFRQALNVQVTRSRRYGNPLTVVLGQLEVASAQTTPLDDVLAAAELAVSRYLRDRLRWADTLARLEPMHFAALLPETRAQEARRLAASISEGVDNLPLPASCQGLPLRLRFGVAEWQQGHDPRVLVQQAEANLQSSDAR